MTELEHKRESRKKQTGEEMTPCELVSEMLDKIPSSCFSDPSKTFIDPAAGNGNFLVEVLSRKLSHNHPPLQALSTIYATELMQDNVDEMKTRLLDVLLKHHPHLSDADIQSAKDIIDHNIICADALKFDFDNWCKRPVRKAKSLF
jgi:type I restriction-modification system DNA methylase subunit